MTRKFKGAPLKNKELVLIYNYLTDQITRDELSQKLKRTRTNTYYYIGRALHYWVEKGILKFKKITDDKDLGGRDI